MTGSSKSLWSVDWGERMNPTILINSVVNLKRLHPRADPRTCAPQVTDVAHSFVPVWEEVAALMGELDVLLGFAELAATAPSPYVRPTMLPADDGEIVLIGALHSL